MFLLVFFFFLSYFGALFSSLLVCVSLICFIPRVAEPMLLFVQTAPQGKPETDAVNAGFCFFTCNVSGFQFVKCLITQVISLTHFLT